jgi:hypothetical protein
MEPPLFFETVNNVLKPRQPPALPPSDNGGKGRKIGTGGAKPPKERRFTLPEPGQTAPIP